MRMTNPSISRRKFAQLLGVGAACAVAKPALSFATDPVTQPAAGSSASASIVRLSSNENPYGPSPQALKAMNDAFNLACRYPDDHADLLIEALTKANGVSREQILLGDGSGEILKLGAVAFTGPMPGGKNGTAAPAPAKGDNASRAVSPGRGNLVAADPTFEAILKHASVNGAGVVKVPLTSSF